MAGEKLSQEEEKEEKEKVGAIIKTKRQRRGLRGQSVLEDMGTNPPFCQSPTHVFNTWNDSCHTREDQTQHHPDGKISILIPLGPFLKERKNTTSSYFDVSNVFPSLPWATHVKARELQSG